MDASAGCEKRKGAGAAGLRRMKRHLPLAARNPFWLLRASSLVYDDVLLGRADCYGPVTVRSSSVAQAPGRAEATGRSDPPGSGPKTRCHAQAEKKRIQR